jgi:hypothetical protein
MLHLILAVWIGAGYIKALDNQAIYDAPVPQRCATFDSRYSVDNREFCDQWMNEHHIVRIVEAHTP